MRRGAWRAWADHLIVVIVGLLLIPVVVDQLLAAEIIGAGRAELRTYIQVPPSLSGSVERAEVRTTTEEGVKRRTEVAVALYYKTPVEPERVREGVVAWVPAEAQLGSVPDVQKTLSPDEQFEVDEDVLWGATVPKGRFARMSQFAAQRVGDGPLGVVMQELRFRVETPAFRRPSIDSTVVRLAWDRSLSPKAGLGGSKEIPIELWGCRECIESTAVDPVTVTPSQFLLATGAANDSLEAEYTVVNPLLRHLVSVPARALLGAVFLGLLLDRWRAAKEAGPPVAPTARPLRATDPKTGEPVTRAPFGASRSRSKPRRVQGRRRRP